jgi:tetratricopeptide (TPR) repeat protein
MLASTSSSSRMAARAANAAPVARRAPAPIPRRQHRTAAASSDGAAAPDPSSAKEAIDRGLALFQQQRYADALALFERAPTLPGTGVKRFRDKPPQASDGEVQAARYNSACAHAALGAADQGLAALAACLGAGYEDFNQIERDPDLATLRADPRYQQLMARYRPKNTGGLFGALFRR